MGHAQVGGVSLFLNQAFSNELPEYKCEPPREDNPPQVNDTSAFQALNSIILCVSSLIGIFISLKGSSQRL